MKTATLWEELAELVGQPLARALVTSCGGQHIYIPKPPGAAPDNLSSARFLSDLLGAEVAVKVRHEFPGMRVYVPSPLKEKVAQRARSIAEMKKAGASNAEIIRAHGLSIRGVQGILARSRG